MVDYVIEVVNIKCFVLSRDCYRLQLSALTQVHKAIDWLLSDDMINELIAYCCKSKILTDN